MEVLPVINCLDVADVRERVAAAKAFLKEGDFLHLDVADGAFTFHKTWANPKEWAELRAPFNLEVHLMVEHPEKYIEPWLAAGAKRFVIHVETVERTMFEWMLARCRERGAEIMLSSNPETPAKKLAPYFGRTRFFKYSLSIPAQRRKNFCRSRSRR